MSKRKAGQGRSYDSINDDAGRAVSEETSTTRLFAEDLVEVKAMCVGGKTKSDVIRELVRRAIYAKRYRQATNDPAFRELLRTFDDMVGVRLHHLERRLRAQMDADFEAMIAAVGYIYFTEYFGMEEMRRLSLELTPDEVTEEEFAEEWQARFDRIKEESAVTLRSLLDQRKRRCAAIDKSKGQGFDSESDGGG